MAFDSLAGAPEIVQPNGLSPNDLDIDWMTSTNDHSPDPAAPRTGRKVVPDRFLVTEFALFPPSSFTHMAQTGVAHHPNGGT
ncbi:hypothetical protein [Saccharomonospora sp. CUA-673]|uniref:hypothetical protein n=1 Tax=Saccharomonospora sp. CUA-673 TaxID=1904969 RepID=UPI0011150738|nr:hypothetical protein [Saccharomonospora sp. CUA-673]